MLAHAHVLQLLLRQPISLPEVTLRPLPPLLSTLRLLLSIVYLLKRLIISRHVARVVYTLEQMVILLDELVRNLLFFFTDYVLIIFKELRSFFFRSCLR